MCLQNSFPWIVFNQEFQEFVKLCNSESNEIFLKNEGNIWKNIKTTTTTKLWVFNLVQFDIVQRFKDFHLEVIVSTKGVSYISKDQLLCASLGQRSYHSPIGGAQSGSISQVQKQLPVSAQLHPQLLSFWKKRKKTWLMYDLEVRTIFPFVQNLDSKF